MVGGGHGGCELRSEAFVKIREKKIFFFFFWGGGSGGVGFGGQGGCKRRSKVFCENSKKKLRGGGVRVGWDGVRSGVGVGEVGYRVWGRWVMWGMGDVNKE